MKSANANVLQFSFWMEYLVLVRKESEQSKTQNKQEENNITKGAHIMGWNRRDS